MDEINRKVNLSYDQTSLDGSDPNDQLFLFIVWGLILPVVACMGLVGNILTMVVLWRREMQSTTILYLRVLVLTDTGILVGVVLCLTPISCAGYLSGETLQYYRDIIYPFFHTPGYYVVMSLQQSNVWITVAVSMERYIAICHPFRAARLITRKRTKIILAGIVVLSFIYNIPRLFATYARYCRSHSFAGHRISNHTTSTSLEYLTTTTAMSFQPSSTPLGISLEKNASQCYEVADTDFGESKAYNSYKTVMYGAIIHVIPFLALLILNSFLIKELMIMQRRRSGTNINDENEANLSLVLVLIVVVFIFCQTPGLISQFDVIPADVFFHWLGISNLMFATNSAVNFLIYTAFGQKFRRVLLRVVRHFYRKSQMAQTSSYRGCQYTLNDYEMSAAGSVHKDSRPSELTALCTPTNGLTCNGHENGEIMTSLDSGTSFKKVICNGDGNNICNGEDQNVCNGEDHNIPGSKKGDGDFV